MEAKVRDATNDEPWYVFLRSVRGNETDNVLQGCEFHIDAGDCTRVRHTQLSVLVDANIVTRQNRTFNL